MTNQELRKKAERLNDFAKRFLKDESMSMEVYHKVLNSLTSSINLPLERLINNFPYKGVSHMNAEQLENYIINYQSWFTKSNA